MPAQRDIAVLVGSLRKESYNRRAAEALTRLAPPQLRFRFIDIVVPLYNQDLDTDVPPADWKRLRDDIRPADAVLFATPEYNRSVPGVLQNAIDVASRPYGKGAINGKPAAIMSVSPAPSAVSAPTTICASLPSSSTCQCCSSRKCTSAPPAVSGTSRAPSRAKRPERCSRNSPPRSPAGSTFMQIERASERNP